MSSGNKVFCRGENPMGMFVPHNVPRANRQSNPQQCRRRMRTEQQGLSADGVAIFRANSLVRPLTVLTRKCQTTTDYSANGGTAASPTIFEVAITHQLIKKLCCNRDRENALN